MSTALRRVRLARLALLLTYTSISVAQEPTPPITSVAPGTIGADGAYRVGNGVLPPTALTRAAPETPDLARKLRAQGAVVLSMVVQSDGTLRDITVVKSVGYGMDEKAIESVRKWRFRAGTKDGAAVDVRIQVEVNFGLQLEPKVWGAGPLIFTAASGVKPPVLISGTMPSPARDGGNEVVLLQFTVSTDGEAGAIQPLEGKDSQSLPTLIASISRWRFSPATSVAGPLPATGKILLIKGESQFRYEVSSAFRDSGTTRLPEQKPAGATVPSSNVTSSVTVVTIPLRVTLDPDEAKRQLVEQVPPQYPAEAKQARIEGTVVLAIIIGADGSVKDVREVDGPRQLIPAAVAAVKKWRYRPALFRGQPREATTEVELQFKLPQ